MKRSQPLRPTGRLRRRAALRAKGGSRFPKRRDRAYTDWISSLPCTVASRECWGRIDPAHIGRTRGAGAYDRGEVAPLCRFHHRQQEGRTAAFCERYGVNLHWIALELDGLYTRLTCSGVDLGCRPTPARGRDET